MLSFRIVQWRGKGGGCDSYGEKCWTEGHWEEIYFEKILFADDTDLEWIRFERQTKQCISILNEKREIQYGNDEVKHIRMTQRTKSEAEWKGFVRCV